MSRETSNPRAIPRADSPDSPSNSDATIFALSSGAPPAAIAIVRISGEKAHSALAALCADAPLPEPRTARLRKLYHPTSGDMLDSALVLIFAAPHSASGEDMVELHLHGGRAVVAAVEQALASLAGLRRAEAGEFTRRAFANGCLDLAEAEGLADLLAAESESQRKQALAAAEGHISQRVTAWQATILALSATAEAELQYGDEETDRPDSAESPAESPQAVSASLASAMAGLASDMQAWLARPAAERVRDGLLVAIAGPPNAGKSTLLNAIAQREVAIVSAHAGTTRDIVEIPLALEGIAMRLADTAGLRDIADRTTATDTATATATGTATTAVVDDKDIEAIGIARAQNLLGMADMVLWLGDPADAPVHPCCLLIAAQADRRAVEDTQWAAICAASDVVISAQTGAGMEALHTAMVERARKLLPSEGEVALHRRQREALHEACAWLTIESGESGDGGAVAADMVLVAEHLRLAAHALDKITGRAGVENMLDTLFARFCIGK